MKNTGVCPKCQSRDLKIGARSGYSAIHFPRFWFLGGATDVYVCTSCGYVEEYVVEKTLAKLRQR